MPRHVSWTRIGFKPLYAIRLAPCGVSNTAQWAAVNDMEMDYPVKIDFQECQWALSDYSKVFRTPPNTSIYSVLEGSLIGWSSNLL